MSNHLQAADLADIFGIEIDNGTPMGATEVAIILCGKCHGAGRFIGRNGKPLGPCFACDGTGLARGAGVVLAPGGCIKCAGSGQWRTGRPCFACNGTGREVVAAEITVDAIVTAFAKARANGIKTPRLRLDTFTFSRAPDTGRNAGAIYVKDGGEYIGKVSDGRFHPTMACDEPTKARVITVAADPHNAAKAYGAKTGSCSCCGRELSNAESVELGIGPICRDKFGWG